jgi:hypothetical protein
MVMVFMDVTIDSLNVEHPVEDSVKEIVDQKQSR